MIIFFECWRFEDARRTDAAADYTTRVTSELCDVSGEGRGTGGGERADDSGHLRAAATGEW